MLKVNTLYIKNMVCPRCIKVVREELIKLDVEVLDVSLGEVKTLQSHSELPLEEISKVMKDNGFELIEDKKSKIIEQIKKNIISIIQNYNEIDMGKVSFPNKLVDNIGKDYNYLSSLFSKTEGITIEHYIILQKVEKVKELLKYDELTLSEIAYLLGYSSVQHLSRQFKSATGLTASQFKDGQNIRKSIDFIGN